MLSENIFLVLIAFYMYSATAQFVTQLSKKIARLDQALPECQIEEVETWLRNPDLSRLPPCHLPRLDHNHKGHSPAFCYAAGKNALCHD